MPHGTNCHCMICTIGKKIGMIRPASDQNHANHNNACGDHCDQTKKNTPK